MLKDLGIPWGRGKLKVWGIFGGKSPRKPKVWGGDGDKAVEMFVVGFGTGKTSIFGIFRGKIPQKTRISGWGREKDSRGFS